MKLTCIAVFVVFASVTFTGMLDFLLPITKIIIYRENLNVDAWGGNTLKLRKTILDIDNNL